MRQATGIDIRAYYAAQGIAVKVSHIGLVYTIDGRKAGHLIGFKGDFYVDNRGALIHDPK